MNVQVSSTRDKFDGHVVECPSSLLGVHGDVGLAFHATVIDSESCPSSGLRDLQQDVHMNPDTLVDCTSLSSNKKLVAFEGQNSRQLLSHSVEQQMVVSVRAP